MGASESTSRSNVTEEDDPQRENNRRSGGSSMGAGALATAAVVGVGVAAIGISRLLSDNTNTLERVPMGTNSTRSHPPRGPYKMTTDGGCNLVLGDRGPGWYGGVLLDHDGLELLDELDLEGAILYNDNEQACEYVNGVGEYRGRSDVVRKSWHIIIKCRNLANKNNIEVKHIGREGTKYAHKLAKMAIAKKEEYEEIEELPYELTLI
ncbi:putative ribonuclease H-like superfamily [Helianthus annuus]|nr:putative ribonuclease H-like superfamily [Helianthus annuus]